MPTYDDTGLKTYMLPAEPSPDVTQVESIHDPRNRYVRTAYTGKWRSSSGVYFSWMLLLEKHLDGLREVKEDPYDAAVRRLRELTPHELERVLVPGSLNVATVIRKVVAGD